MSYSPTIGAWVEKDPGGYIDGPNAYEFVHDNPTDHLDPFGLYDTGGHYWTVYATAIAAGNPPAVAEVLAYFSQYPDQYEQTDPVWLYKYDIAKKGALSSNPNVWGTQIALAELAIVILGVGTVIPLAKSACLMSAAGVMTIFVAWGSFYCATDRGSYLYVLNSSALFLAILAVRAFSLAPFFAFWVKDRSTVAPTRALDVAEFAALVLGAVVIVAAYMVWRTHNTSDFIFGPNRGQ